MSDLFSLEGKHAVVTGGSRGIGMMIAAGLLRAGACVMITSRKAAACDAAVTELAHFGEVHAVPADLSREEECLRLASCVEGPLHILVNNAGAAWAAPIDEFPAEAWDTVLNVNLKAPFFLSRAFLPSLRQAASAEDPARIINVGSIDGLHVNPLPHYAYSASKAAIHHLTRVLARELAPQCVTVNAIAPGPFHTKMMAFALDDPASRRGVEARVPLGRIGTDDDMAGAAVFLSSRASSYITGVVMPVDGGIVGAL